MKRLFAFSSIIVFLFTAFVFTSCSNIFEDKSNSGELVIQGLNTDQNYTVYLAVQDKSRKPVGDELQVQTNYRDTVTFVLTGEFTDLLQVDRNESFSVYYYGIKVCSSSTLLEDTLIFENSDIGDLNTITVYPKKVEGI